MDEDLQVATQRDQPAQMFDAEALWETASTWADAIAD